MSVTLGGNIIVTGANRGIGLELIRQLVEHAEEIHIFACCREPEGARAKALGELADQHSEQITIVKLDTTDEASILAAVQKIGERVNAHGLNLLINNAGINKPDSPAPLSLTNKTEMMEVYETNVVGPFLLAKMLLPYLQRAAEGNSTPEVKGGRMSCRRSAIINISSLVGSIEKCPENFPRAQMYAYRLSKAALNMLTRCLAEDFKKYNVLVTAIHPGWVQTEMGGNEAPLPKQESVQGMLQVMSWLSNKDSGTLLDWQGNSIPW
ncbi:C-factor [Lampris incognitus]|uniref:C-factor n=1 Tax=Lampris incognitus TaxID=2546036 RepID=UPI0024B60AB2|nr:C-factor [Lampris incognitus]